jgi:hypothetical protein
MADRRCSLPQLDAVLRPDFVNRHRNGCTKPVARFVCLRPILARMPSSSTMVAETCRNSPLCVS